MSDDVARTRKDYVCPACGFDHASSENVCRCGAELSLLHELDALIDGWFSRGTLAHAEGDHAEAILWISATCAARPLDAEPHVELAKVWLDLGRPDYAARAFARAGLGPSGDGPEVAAGNVVENSAVPPSE
jgi:hypothetical protein